MRQRLQTLGWLLAFGTLSLVARADVLIGTNGERFVGTVIEDTTNTVVFDSEFGGRLILSRMQVRELRRTTPAEIKPAPVPPPAPTNTAGTPLSTNLAWRPPGIGHDGSDWIQFKSGEWLKGDLKYIQNKEVDFDSDELEELALKLKDLRQVYTARRVFTKFEDQEPLYGIVVVSNDVVTVHGSNVVSMPLEQLTGITPAGGKNGIRYWSGKASLGLSLQSGNNHQTTLSTSAELARRTPSTELLLNYLGNFSEANGVENANNERVNLTYDIRLDHGWFVRPVQFEYFHDALANIAYRLTGGVGAGYYIFDSFTLKWTVAAGPGYQYTRFETVELNQADTASTPAAVFQSNFDFDITRRLTLIQTFQSIFTKREAGRYTHHAVTTLEFEIKRHLNLDTSFVWDFLQNPQTESDGTIPEKSDYYLTVGLGVRF